MHVFTHVGVFNYTGHINVGQTGWEDAMKLALNDGNFVNNMQQEMDQ